MTRRSVKDWMFSPKPVLCTTLRKCPLRVVLCKHNPAPESKKKTAKSGKSGKSGTKAHHAELEDNVIAWYNQQVATQIVRPAVLWQKVASVKAELNITAKLGKNWKESFLRRHQLLFRREKRAIKLDKATLSERLASFHTFVQAMHMQHNFDVVGNFDEAPVSFNGEFVRSMVVNEQLSTEDTIAFGTSSSEVQVAFHK